MPRLIEIPLTIPPGERLHENIGSCLHGALMQIVDSEVANWLHSPGLRPYSQSLIHDQKNCPIWRIGVLLPNIEDAIFDAVIRHDNIYLKNRGFSISLSNPIIRQSESYNRLIEECSTTSPPDGVNFEFLTTISFRSDNKYIIYPDLRLIWQSLIWRWNAFSNQPLENGMAFALAPFTEIVAYDLHSKNFSVSGSHIPGFYGKMKVAFNGNQQANSLLGMLAKFANFAGIGIKTALGMGATKAQ